ncbi:MAG: arsenite efflux MFS transporter ArsK [Rhizobiaceae bacterium]
MSDLRAPASAVWALGLTQITGYGTLYYSFAILAPAMARDFSLSEQWIFGALSLALFAGSLLAPTAGRLADRFGAGRVMSWGSAAAALGLVAAGMAPNAALFAAALIFMELAACFVLYATAFVAIVQLGNAGASRSITHLTLIAGFASTVFWPLTTALHAELSWREVYFVFAALNLGLCLPIHLWLRRRPRPLAAAAPDLSPAAPAPDERPVAPGRRTAAFLWMMGGFAAAGFVLSAVLLHMVPLLTALGLGTAGVLVSTLFGPSQVASRLINMMFGGRLPQTILAVIATTLLAAGLILLLTGAPDVAAIAIFVVLFGLGSGLISIVGGTLPLEVFGRVGYGARVGWMSAARQFTSSFAPFLLAVMMAGLSVGVSLAVLLAMALVGVLAFAVIVWLQRLSAPIAASRGPTPA